MRICLFQSFLFLISIYQSHASSGIYPVYPIVEHIQPLHRRDSVPKPSECPTDFKPCQATGKPFSVCCPLSSVCSPSTLSSAGIICCLHPPCADNTPLSCPSNRFFHCAPNDGGGCCPNGTICRNTLCIIDPTATTTTSATPSPAMTPPPRTGVSGEVVRGWPSVAIDVDGDGLSGSQDPVEEIPLTSGELDWRTGKPVVTGTVGYGTRKLRETGGQGMLVPELARETDGVAKGVVIEVAKKGGAGRNTGGEWGVFGVAAVAFIAAVVGRGV